MKTIKQFLGKYWHVRYEKYDNVRVCNHSECNYTQTFETYDFPQDSHQKVMFMTPYEKFSRQIVKTKVRIDLLTEKKRLLNLEQSKEFVDEWTSTILK